MSDHDCIHEQDFGILFTKVDLMTESFKIMRTSNEALKTAVDRVFVFNKGQFNVRDREWNIDLIELIQ